MSEDPPTSLIPSFLKKREPSETDKTLFNYRRIWMYAVLGTAIVSLMPLFVLAAWTVIQYQNTIKAEAKLPIHSLVTNAEQSISLYIDERKSTLRFMVEDNTYEQLSDEERLKEVMNNLRIALGDIVDLGIISSGGIQHTYVGPYDLKNKNYHNEPWFQEVRVRGVHVSEVFLGFREFPHIVIAVKHKRDNNDFFILRMTLDMQKFNGIIKALQIHSGSDIFLINDEGVIQTPSRSYGRVLEKIPFAPPRPGAGVDLTEIRNNAENQRIIGYSMVSKTPFILLVVQEQKGLFEYGEEFLGQLIGFLIISTIVILAFILRVSTIMVRRIEEADKKRVSFLHNIEHTNKMASIGRLAAGVAHEINNPLAIINQKAGLLSDIFSTSQDIPQKEQFLKVIKSITKSVDRCSTITYRLLGFARHIDVSTETLEPESLIREVLSFLEKEAEYRNIEITLDPGNDVPPITSDRGQLQQVFLNIINNAMAAVPKGGKIDIGIFCPYPRHIAVTISDNGVGIGPDHIDKIFEPFFTTKNREGTGLGLSITYGIVKKLGGKIKVESELEKGTRFTVTLPTNN